MIVSQKTIAKRLGVSQALVSQAFGHRSSNIRLSEKTRRRILREAEALNYRPCPIARALRTNRSATIGIVGHSYLPARGSYVSAIVTALNARGYEALHTLAPWKVDEETQAIQRFLDRRVDGVIVDSPGIDKPRHAGIEALISNSLPTVSIGPVASKQVSCVDWDRRATYKTLTQHLLKNGCSRLAFVAYLPTPGTKQRIEGIRQATQNTSGVKLEIVYCGQENASASKDEAAIRGAFTKFSKHGWPDGLICITDVLAMIALKIAKELGRKVPDDLAIIGGSDAVFGRFLEVPLTTFSMPFEQIGKTAVDVLFRLMNARDKKPQPINELIPARLIVRKSSLFGQGSGAKKD